MNPPPVHEHEFEPQYGLPERLPPGEYLLWQGTPCWRVVARRVFHVRKVAVYFALLLAWRLAELGYDGGGVAEALGLLRWLVPTMAIGLGLLLLLAWLTARASVYTLTDRRIVMRIGIVLTVAYNLPLRRIDGARLHDLGHGCADIALALEPGTRIAWLHLWPHVRPWHLRRPEPMLRALPEAAQVAAKIQAAWAQANAQQPEAAPTAATAGTSTPVDTPARVPPAGLPASALRPVLAGR